MHEVLSDSNGHTYGITIQEAQAAKTLFEKIEGIDIMSPGAVALAALQQAVEKQIVVQMSEFYSIFQGRC